MPKVQKIKIALIGGGTGGHIYPLLAVHDTLSHAANEKGLVPDIRYFGDAGDFRTVLMQRSIRMHHIASSKWRRYFDLRNIVDIFKFGFGFLEALSKLYFFMPHVCFSKGGPGSFPILLAAHFYFIPIVVHESDSIPGVANALAAKFASVVDVGFKEAEAYFPRRAVHVTGNPVRSEILESQDEDASSRTRAARLELGLNPELPTLLFLGGSQGAETLNVFLLEHVTTLLDSFQVIHQTGERNFERYVREFDFSNAKLAPGLRARYVPRPYFENPRSAYDAADLVVARSGASTLAELAILGKPSVLIPIASSPNDHQRKNAYAYAATGAASVIEEENLLPHIVSQELARILGRSEICQAMQRSAKSAAVPQSAVLISEDILRTARIS